MLNQSLRKFFLYFTLHETEVPPRILTRTSVLSSPSGPSAALLAKCPVISLAHSLTVEILLTIITPCSVQKSKASLGIQLRLKFRGFSTKFYTGPTPHPFIYHLRQKRYPFVYLLFNGTSFTSLVQCIASLLTVVNALSFKYE